jgi:hypothetical protein
MGYIAVVTQVIWTEGELVKHARIRAGIVKLHIGQFIRKL